MNNNTNDSNPMAANGGNGNPWLNYYQQWCDRTPYVTRTSTVAMCVLYLFSFLIPLDSYLGNTPYFTIQHFEIYRLFLSPLVGNSILMLIIILMSYPAMGQRMENSSGSSSFLSLLCILTLVINIIFTGLCYSMYIFNILPESIFWRSAGFFMIFFSLLTIDCLLVWSAHIHSNVMVLITRFDRFLTLLDDSCSYQ
jgi:hypothetical protein